MALQGWVVLTAIMMAISGCLADDEEPDEAPTGQDVPDPEGTTEPVQTVYECDVLVGAVVISLTTDLGGIGGCNVVDLESTAQFVEASAPAGCSVQYDANGDGQSDGEAAPGATYEGGTSLVAFCGPGVLQETVSVTMAS